MTLTTNLKSAKLFLTFRYFWFLKHIKNGQEITTTN